MADSCTECRRSLIYSARGRGTGLCHPCAHKALVALRNAIPKCWRLDNDGTLVQDVPIVPGLIVWRRWARQNIQGAVIAVEADVIWCPGTSYDRTGLSPDQLYITESAAKAAMENQS